MFGITNWWLFISTALKSSLGLALGYLLYVLLTFIGLTIILPTYPVLTNIIKISGGLYLVYLGIMSLLDKSITLNTIDNYTIKSKNIILKGFLVSALNPKVGLFFLSFLPQFISMNYNKIGIIVLGVLFCMSATIFNLSYYYVFSYIATGNRYRIVKMLSGVILIVLGVMVIIR
ncbi:MAG: LysE family translocator [Burkholderiales bacterium]|nr:LysE family translocator [Burkholderiales bacterium]